MRACTFRSLIVIGTVLSAAPVSAQVDPMLFLKPQGTNGANLAAPNVIVVMDTSNRMQRDAPTDPANPRTTSNYYDPILYPRDITQVWQTTTLNVTALNTTAFYRRRYTGLDYAPGGAGDKFTATIIGVLRDRDPNYALFEAPTKLAIARAALYQAIVENQSVARFSLVKMRQTNPTKASPSGNVGNSGPVADAEPTQVTPTDVNGSTNGRWTIGRNTVGGTNNGAVSAPSSNNAAIVHADSDPATTLLNILATDSRGAWQAVSGAAPTPMPTPLIPAGGDDQNTQDTPVNNMLVDAKAEATRLVGINNDPACRNTIIVLIVGGGEGNTTSGVTNSTLGSTASGFLNISTRRVPVYVIALGGQSASDRSALQAIAANSGGQYFEISKAVIDNALNTAQTVYPTGINGTIVVPHVVRAINTAIAHTFASSTEFNTAPVAGSTPFGPSTEYQVTSPIIGMVDMSNGVDISNTALPLTVVTDKQGNVIPQRSNLMVTSGVSVPATGGQLGMNGTLRAFRVYKPVADSTQLSGWKFVADGTRLWVACAPGTVVNPATGATCTTPTGTVLSDPSVRNLYTSAADGTMIAFTTANAATLAPLMNLSVSAATDVITFVRALPIGPIFSSTPAVMGPPSLDPPPDDSYPAFAVANKGRRSIAFFGTNFGIIEGIDSRIGVEVWGFIPLNLLPKLKTLRDGQPVGKFDFFVDSSPKIADVRLTGICTSDHPELCWRTHMIIGEGNGGTFYQSFDVTMADQVSSGLASGSDDINAVLTYFSSPGKITLNWAFPKYSDFDATIAPYGDISASAPTVEKTVGQTTSDPAVGEVLSNSGPYSVLIGSGFLPYSTQQKANRGGTVAGTTFYIIDAKTGTLFDSKDVGSDGVNETVDDCRTNANGCTNIKNALQSDPVATGPSDSRFITKTYVGDLDGNLWRFDIGLDGSNNPKINVTTKLYASGANQPIFGSMATVNVGGTQQYVFFGTGSDRLPGTDKNTTYHLLAVLDNGSTGSKTLDQVLTKTNGNNITQDERVTAFPAVAGDIVFFTTTTFNDTACGSPNANLYAFTFIGGPAYDNTGDNAVTNKDTPLIKTIAGVRATAPFIVDQHLAFATGGNIQMFGDPQAYNNGVGQAGVRILSWREVR